MSRHDCFNISDFYCCNCATKGMPIARKLSKQKEVEHYKVIYCLVCKQELNHIEVREFDHNKEDVVRDIKEGKYKDIAGGR